jgi:hypothetical protein
MAAYRFWVKVFALSFALGVVSGITMSFQFGTNWPGFMERVGNVAGPLLAYEVLTAFFLEAVFLGIMLFGHAGCRTWVHTLATGARRLRHDDVGLLDPGAELLDAHARRASRCATAWPSRPTGGRSSSTRRCPTGSCTCCWPRC